MEDNMSNSVVISGSNGFIGSHLAKYLCEKGYNVFALVVANDATTNTIRNIKGINIIKGDLFDLCSFENKIPMNPIAFFHFAWIGVSPELRGDIEIQKKNIDLTINSIKLASKLKAKKFIFPGSTFEYSFSNSIINRNTNPSPQDAYGATKLSARYYSQILCRKYGIDFIYSVISSIYSEDRIDNNVITYTIRSLLRNEKPALTQLKQKWDYVHINDVVDAFESIIRNGKKDAFYVIGHGDNCPLSEYIFKIRDLINPRLPLGIGEIPYSGDIIPMSCVDLSELKLDTGFEPKISFDQGIVNVIKKIKETEGLR